MVCGMLQTGHGYIERWEVSEEDDCRRAGGGRLYHQQLDFRFRLPEGEPGVARSRFCWLVGGLIGSSVRNAASLNALLPWL